MINYVITEYPINVEALSTWSSNDIGSDTGFILNGMPEYEYISDGYGDNGQVPLKLVIEPDDAATHAVRASNFTLAGQQADAIVFQGGNGQFANGYRYESPNAALPAGVTRVEFWDRFQATPLNPNNYIVVYAWLEPGLNVGMLDQQVTLDIDGDAEEYNSIPEGYYISLESNFDSIPEGGVATITLTTNGLEEGTTVMYAVSGDINTSDVSTQPLQLDPGNVFGAVAGTVVGEVTINYNGGGNQVTTFTITALEDNSLEQNEFAVIQLFASDSNNIQTGQLQAIVEIVDTTEPVVGCRDTEAINYNPFANITCDGSAFYTTPYAEVIDGSNVPCIEDVFGTMQSGDNCCCEYYVQPPSTCCPDPIASNYDPDCIYPCGNCCNYPTSQAYIGFISDLGNDPWGGEYVNTLSQANLLFPHFEEEDDSEFSGVSNTQSDLPPTNSGPPWATKKEKIAADSLNIRFTRGALEYFNMPQQGDLPYSVRSRLGFQGNNVSVASNLWWDGTPGVDRVFQRPFDYTCNEYSLLDGPWTGDLSVCDDWETTPRTLDNVWNNFGGFYMIPQDGYTVSRHNFYVDCERIVFGTELSSRAAADGYSGNGKKMCCGSLSMSNYNGASNASIWLNSQQKNDRFFMFTEGYNQSSLAQSFDQYCCSDEGHPAGSINYNTFKEGTAHIGDVNMDYYSPNSSSYEEGGIAKQNPKLRIEKTIYINPWVYVSYDAYPELEPLPRKKLNMNGHPIEPPDGIGIWNEHPINNIFAAVEIWDMKPLDTWNWCGNLYQTPNPGDPDYIPGSPSINPFNNLTNENYSYIFGYEPLSCCSWEDPNIHNLKHIGVENNYDTTGSPNEGDSDYNPNYGNWLLGSSYGDAQPYWGCNTGDLPYLDKSYLCKASDWFWDFEEGSLNLGTFSEAVLEGLYGNMLSTAQQAMYCAPQGSVSDAGVSCSGLQAFGYQAPYMDLELGGWQAPVGWVGNYTGQLPVNCGVMNSWDGSTGEGSTVDENEASLAEVVTNKPSYFRDRFNSGINQGIVNPGDYAGNYLYVKAVRSYSFGSCGTFSPQDNWPIPASGARFYIKVKGSAMSCPDCSSGEDIFFEVMTDFN